MHRQSMTFKQALKTLNIEDYGERIFHSNSKGELFHLCDYIDMAKSPIGKQKWFRPLFLVCVEFAENNWKRPESVFQHMPQMMRDVLNSMHSSKRDT